MMRFFVLVFVFHILLSCSSSKQYNESQNVNSLNKSQAESCDSSHTQLEISSFSTSDHRNDINITTTTEEVGRWYDNNNNLVFEGKKTTSTTVADKTNEQTTFIHSVDSSSLNQTLLSTKMDSVSSHISSVAADNKSSASTLSFSIGFFVAAAIVIAVITLFAYLRLRI